MILTHQPLLSLPPLSLLFTLQLQSQTQPLEQTEPFHAVHSLVQNASSRQAHLSSFFHRLCCARPAVPLFRNSPSGTRSSCAPLWVPVHLEVPQEQPRLIILAAHMRPGIWPTANKYWLYFVCCICDQRWVHLIHVNLSFLISNRSLSLMILKPL